MVRGPTLTKQRYGFLVALFNVLHVLVYVAWILGMVNRVKIRVLGFIMILPTFIFMGIVDLVSSVWFVYCVLCIVSSLHGNFVRV